MNTSGRRNADFAFSTVHTGCCAHWIDTDLYDWKWGLNWCPFEGVKNMTHYWRPKLNAQLALESSELGTSRILNLASSEYGDVALHGRPMSDVVSCVFLEIKGGKHRSISAYAKAARGAMARFVLTNDIDHPNQLNHFDGLGYAYSGELSSRGRRFFTRTLRP